jgi:hypothetical protein
MSTTFLYKDLWPQLKKAAQASRQPSAVAVAYFGAGAHRLLPLPRGSRLVVDASERAVASGQTCPAELIALVGRGVTVYSVPNLHAKVFVLGRSAFIGSTNVSRHSASQLVEALIRTTESGAVRTARQFVHEHCLHELTPTLLEDLSKLYRSPRVPGAMRVKHSATTHHRPILPRLFLAQLHLEDWSEREQALHDSGLVTAKKHRKHRSSYELDSFIHTGKCIYQRGDILIQITDEGKGTVLASPPGNVLNVSTASNNKRQISCIYLERPSRRRRSVKVLAKQLGRGSIKRLRRQGLVRDRSFSQALLKIWTG